MPGHHCGHHCCSINSIKFSSGLTGDKIKEWKLTFCYIYMYIYCTWNYMVLSWFWETLLLFLYSNINKKNYIQMYIDFVHVTWSRNLESRMDSSFIVLFFDYCWVFFLFNIDYFTFTDIFFDRKQNNTLSSISIRKSWKSCMYLLWHGFKHPTI